MIGLLPILARWRLGLSIFGALAFLGLALAVNHYRHAYHAEKALRKADHAAYVMAQAEASRIAKAALDHAEARYKEKARAADEKTVLAVTAADAATADYARRMRIKAPACGTSAAVAEAPRYGPRFSERAGAASNMVAVTEDDLQVCTTNTIKLESAREWALSLTE